MAYRNKTIHSHSVFRYEATYTYDTKDITVCHTKCTGDEDKLRNCQLDISKSCRCYDGVVGIACSKCQFYLG